MVSKIDYTFPHRSQRCKTSLKIAQMVVKSNGFKYQKLNFDNKHCCCVQIDKYVFRQLAKFLQSLNCGDQYILLEKPDTQIHL